MTMKALEATSIYFRRAARLINSDFHKILLNPVNESKYKCEITKDDGTVESFRGFNVQHDHYRGPMIGGIRFHHLVENDDVTAMAHLMTWKTALVNLPFGGFMTAVKCQPTDLSTAEVERVAREFVHHIYGEIGGSTNILVSDLGTNAQTMDWVSAESGNFYRDYIKGFGSKTPFFISDSLETESATGRGVFFATEALLRDHGKSIKSSTFVIQGFGNVGSWVPRLVHKRGGKIVVVSDVSGALKNPDGIDIPALLEHKEMNGSLSGFEEAENMNADELLVHDCDVLIPCALGGVINRENAEDIRAKFIIEAADHSTDPKVDEILTKKGVTILPDLYANAGGVIFSYLEWLECYKSLLPKENKVNYHLKKYMIEAYGDIKWICYEHKCNLRTGAMRIGVTRALERRLEGRWKI